MPRRKGHWSPASAYRSRYDLTDGFARRMRDALPHASFRVALTKIGRRDSRTSEDIDHAIRQIVSKAVASEEVVDPFTAAGLKKPDISILSDEFLAEVKDLPQRKRGGGDAPAAAE